MCEQDAQERAEWASATQNDTARCVRQCGLECPAAGSGPGHCKGAAPPRGAASDRYL